MRRATENVPHLLPVFRFAGWGCLEWTEHMAGGMLTDKMREVASKFDGVKTLRDLESLGVDMSVANQLIEQEFAILVSGRESKLPTERWCVISPHSDDAALSVGGFLATLSESVDISILTMIGQSRCAGTCAPLYGDTLKVTQIRKAEDDLYGKLIGASVYCADLDDVEMYVDKEGARWADRIMDTPDQLRLELFTTALSAHLDQHKPDVILAPLAVGAHGDHAATHLALWSLLPEIYKRAPFTRIMFYEDLPYCQFDQPALERRLKDFDQLVPVEIAIDLVKKIQAVSIYRSQYTTAEIAGELIHYAEKSATGKVGAFAERLWELARSSSK